MFVRLGLAAVVAASISSAAMARDYVSIAGSSTVLPFSTIVAEAAGKRPGVKTPVVESGGSSVGKKGACTGIGTENIDIGNASSRMKVSELDVCAENNVEVTEIKVGYDGIVLASDRSGPELDVTREQLWLALAANVPNAEGTAFVPNFYTTWNEIDASLPNIAIRVLGPPTTSGTRASWEEMVNEKGGCKQNAAAKAILKAEGKSAKTCRPLRTDGGYVEAGEQDNLIVQKLQEDNSSFGVFGFSYLDQNSDVLQAAKVGGVAPTFEDIAAGDYPVSRSLFFYIKKAHVGVVPGIQEYAREWTKHWGEDGILAESGMIPMGEDERAVYADAIENLPTLTADMLD
ncbi:phosphate ABC transporter substrate-binding protein [Litorivicinus lipolyticus]|uniref:Phosphate ABC transporter substrate-binding protein n=1 Tax=Litorivicinus lipolyticus TaxID=418701 RepID=A0A5Q2Q5D8_9GAMM|nr:substrate-binding domain-containing protein [Litorivicinus lipolyticus]QGG79189.1 phosphate ABC transporter substrate-binding protein [Litorivicinus lipolyticus]